MTTQPVTTPKPKFAIAAAAVSLRYGVVEEAVAAAEDDVTPQRLQQDRRPKGERVLLLPLPKKARVRLRTLRKTRRVSGPRRRRLSKLGRRLKMGQLILDPSMLGP